MALTVADGDVVVCKLRFDNFAKETAYNVLHYQVTNKTGTTPSSGVALATAAQAMYNHWSNPWQQAASNEIYFESVTLTSAFPLPRSVSVTFQPTVPDVGALSSEALPLQDTPTLLKLTDVGNRWGMGRMFYAGTAESQQKDGKLTAAGVASIAGAVTRLRESLTVTGTGYSFVLRPVLVSGPDDNPTRITTITGSRLSDNIIKMQRRRRPGKGA